MVTSERTRQVPSLEQPTRKRKWMVKLVPLIGGMEMLIFEVGLFLRVVKLREPGAFLEDGCSKV